MYNKKTAWENQKEFLKTQMSCGFPNIERVTKENYERMIKAEKEAKELNEKLKVAGLIE